MEPEPKHRAREKVLSVADWDSPEHAVRSIRRAIIASWLVLPLIGVALLYSRSFSSQDMRDLSFVVLMPSFFLARWLLRKDVPAQTDEMKCHPGMLVLGFASAAGLLGGAIANNSRIMAISACGMGVEFLYIFVHAIAAEVRLFRDPLRYLVPTKETVGTRSPE